MKLPLRLANKSKTALKKSFIPNSFVNTMKRNYACGGGVCDGSGGCGGKGGHHHHNHPEEIATLNSNQPTHSHAFGQYTSNVNDPKNSDTVNIFLNGLPIRVPKNLTILEAQLFYNKFVAKNMDIMGEKSQVDIPTLCYHPRLKEHSPANCRICLVEEEINPLDVEQQMSYAIRRPYPKPEERLTKLVPSCTNHVKEGGCYWTRTQTTHENTRSILKFLLSHHNLDCPSCSANGMCELQDLLEKYHISKKDLPPSLRDNFTNTSSEEVLVSNIGTPEYMTIGDIQIDPDKCIRCTRCIRTCTFIQERDALSMSGRGHNESVQQLNLVLSEVSNGTEERSPCISCGQCSQICPVGAISIKAQLDEVSELLLQKSVMNAFDNKEKDYIMVASTAPAVRVAISEEFGKEPGHYTASQMVQGLRKLGFDYVFDTLFSADLTIMEEGTELIKRLTSETPGPFPMYTSCCPGWVNLVESDFPEIIPNVSSCKSPQQMLGSVIRNYWTPKMQQHIKGKKVIHVSIMPCTAKKGEAQRPEMGVPDKDGNIVPDIDYVLTTRELGKLFKMHQVHDLETKSVGNEVGDYDSPIAEGTGAAVIFGVTGGVMEAALRTAYEILEKKPLERLNLQEVRGLDGIRSATINIAGVDVKVGVAHGSGNLKRLVNYTKTLDPKDQFHFIEMMACPSGCVGGGGEPKIVEKLEHQDRVKRRLQAIYKLDEAAITRKSHDNREIQQLYNEYYKEPCGHKAHHELHTHYTNKK
ncbi:iron hydrogenase [Naegleria gruberi]|uniref:Iron hydrogenase n=1 Tax=Naegleria gruberi TaxID=5762 RepID=D2VP17_NAEGR|nr:iron hydrogenase [Naegleria gruberi]EFC41522.1 iron hydrogenase [Naegleria gruberi]|eukprot:XP_002674266.1 iron hydrogenase [Naegleria gruberi strain NEG-M]